MDGNAAYDIFERLAEQFHCHWNPCFKEVGLGYYEGGFVSDAGKMGYIPADASSKRVLMNIALYSDEQWKYHILKLTQPKFKEKESGYKQV